MSNKPFHLAAESADGSQLTLDALYKIAPSCFTEVPDERTGEIRHVVNFTTLRQLLGDDAVDDVPEAYQFTWPGKQAARREAAAPIRKTLRPVKEDSVDWDNTQNVYIEGDNLEALKLLQKSYLGKVKMIYIDPPYNTGNDFVYHDDFAVSQDDYEQQAGAVDELGNKYIKNADTRGRFHSDWCSMMYARLLVARSLLAEEGILYISIGDAEQVNLKKICDEIMGSSNFISCLPRIAKKGSNKGTYFRPTKDYVLCYAKNSTMLPPFGIEARGGMPYPYVENKGQRIGENYRKAHSLYQASLDARAHQRYYIETPDGTLIIPPGNVFPDVKADASYVIPESNADGCWRWSFESYMQHKKENVIMFSRSSQSPLLDSAGNHTDWNVYEKKYEKDEKGKLSLPDDVINNFLNSQATAELAKLKIPFDFSKPVELIEYLYNIMQTDKEGIIMDFFSGSATTAQSVIELNSKDRGNRKFILVQIPENTPVDSEAYQEGYKNICEIGKERIRRAGKAIKKASPETTKDLDTGFRVFRVADSNMEDVYYAPKEYVQGKLDLFLNNVKADRTDLDLLFGCMLDWGVELSLSQSMATEEVDGCTIYAVNDNDLVACFAENITEKVIDAMAAKMPVRVLFRDSGFSRDDAKINIFEAFKQRLGWNDDQARNNIKVI